MKLTAGKCFVAYWVIALLTFGYAANNQEGCSFNIAKNTRTLCEATGGSIAGVFWPLYWTWEGFSIGRQAMKGGSE